jgi:hypothetical protein
MKNSFRLCALLITLLASVCTAPLAKAQSTPASFAGTYQGQVKVATNLGIKTSEFLTTKVIVSSTGLLTITIDKANKPLKGSVAADGSFKVSFSSGQISGTIANGTLIARGSENVPLGLFNLIRGYSFNLTKK